MIIHISSTHLLLINTKGTLLNFDVHTNCLYKFPSDLGSFIKEHMGWKLLEASESAYSHLLCGDSVCFQ
ncbi:hypothetical protein L1987_73655 [Smallanthus sonchifolius]|uniref:Uncharacterized protein n=1 Tax=Smallanthus sonchifolius TaxID=185202 RepID=A0ACB9A0S4_9ASTR|nr:hypothetical protein L1987_73655 [Smallanthus sonchifolius]